MPPTSHIYVTLHYSCGLHIKPTVLYTQVQEQLSTTVTSYIIAKYVPETNMPLTCHIWKLVNVQIPNNYVSIYTSYELNAINSVPRSTAKHTFHIIGICP